MKCHYEILGIERDASDTDIKKSYRKLALKWHPDKNPDRLEECTKTFHLIQQAYEVLIDAQERAWYDKHREAILRGGLGGGDDYKDNSLDVFQYFTASCYSGFNDEEKGFYTVYRQVFETITVEDAEFLDGKDCDFPKFGESTSSYEEVVGPFYGYWESYCTAKSYVWAEKYDTREGPNRQVRRLMEQDNKKLRDKAKKERNEEVRALAAYVKKRDPRVKAYKRKLEERAVEIAQRTEEKRLQQKRERNKKFEGFQESGWSATHGLNDQLATLEANLAEEFSDHDDDSDDDASGLEDIAEDEAVAAEEVLLDDLYCIACNRAFKTQKALSNHEQSKKHKENVESLREHMLEDDVAAMALADDEDDLDEDTEYVLLDDLYCLACQKAFDTEVALSSHVQSKKHLSAIAELTGETNGLPDDGDSANNETADLNNSTKPEVVTEEVPDMKTKTPLTKKKRRRQKVSAAASSETEDIPSEPVPSEPEVNNVAVNSELVEDVSVEEDSVARSVSQHDAGASDYVAEETSATIAGGGCSDGDDFSDDGATEQVPKYCNTCGQHFSSRNKMFEHLKKTKHALRLEEGQPAPHTQAAQKSKKKKKGKKA